MARVLAALLLFGPCQSYRVTDSSVVEASVEAQACDVNTCVTFEDEASECSCQPFVADPILLERAEKTLYEIVQASRYLTDQQAESPGFIRSLYPVRMFTTMQRASLLSSTMKDFEFLQSAMDVLEGVDDLADESASNLVTGDFKAPAGAFPIMVEVWDSDVTRSQFIGEVGVGLSLGEQSYTLPLRPNKNCGTKSLKKAEKGSIGTVTFTTKVEMGAKKLCNPGKTEECAPISVTVSCDKASGLPSMDQFSKSDPYCKVRLKSSDIQPSAHFKTRAIDNTVNPDWTSMEHSFTASFMVLVDGDKPWSIDSMSLTGQFMANTRLMAKMLVLGGKECPDIESKSKRQQQVCDLLWASTTSIDPATLQEAAGSLNAEDAQVIAKMAEDAKDAGDESSLTEMGQGQGHSDESQRALLAYPGCSCCHMAHHRRVRRGTRRYHGRTYYSGRSYNRDYRRSPRVYNPQDPDPHEGGGASVIAAVIVLLLLLL